LCSGKEETKVHPLSLEKEQVTGSVSSLDFGKSDGFDELERIADNMQMASAFRTLDGVCLSEQQKMDEF
jgi:hypothetical protein